MLDHRTQAAALAAFRTALGGQSLVDPDVARLRDQHLDDVSAAPSSAMLGALLDHLLWLAAVGEDEVDLLEEVAALWRTGLDLYAALDRFRVTLQRCLDDPLDAAAVQDLNAAGNALRVLAPAVQQDLTALRRLREAVARHDYVPEHPRRRDLPARAWDWSDLAHGRRTDALVRELFRLADTPQARAFAVGALSRYGADVSGSLYLSQTVGGPRRSHRLRHRLARGSVGAWIASHVPGTPSLSELADLLEGGLDADVEDMLDSALTTVLDDPSLPAPPQLGEAADRLVTHLRLMDSIRVPAPPAPLSDRLVVTVLADPAVPYVPTLTPQTGLVESGGQPGVPGSGGGPTIQSYGDDGPTQQQPPDSTEVKCGAFWEALGWGLLFLLGGWFACVLRWKDDQRCPLWDDITQNWEAAFSNGAYAGGEVETGWAAQGLTPADTATLAARPEVLQLAVDLYGLQNQLWEGLSKAAEFLALHGLVPPDGYDHLRRYRQFTTVPPHDPGWPRRAYDGPDFHEYAPTAPESPAEEPRFRPGSPPSAILTGLGGGGQLSASSVSLPLWLQVASGTFDSQNLDLDADRGWRHPCWRTAGSIADQPVGVVVVGYEEI